MQRRTLSEPEKKLVAARQGWRCSACATLLPACYQIDHTVPLWQQGEDSIENATAMCPNCHAAKTQLEAIERHANVKTAKPLYENRIDVFVTSRTVRCTMCHRVRNVAEGHEICSAIETPHARVAALQNRLAAFAYAPRRATANRIGYK